MERNRQRTFFLPEIDAVQESQTLSGKMEQPFEFVSKEGSLDRWRRPRNAEFSQVQREKVVFARQTLQPEKNLASNKKSL